MYRLNAGNLPRERLYAPRKVDIVWTENVPSTGQPAKRLFLPPRTQYHPENTEREGVEGVLDHHEAYFVYVTRGDRTVKSGKESGLWVSRTGDCWIYVSGMILQMSDVTHFVIGGSAIRLREPVRIIYCLLVRELRGNINVYLLCGVFKENWTMCVRIRMYFFFPLVRKMVDTKLWSIYRYALSK